MKKLIFLVLVLVACGKTNYGSVGGQNYVYEASLCGPSGKCKVVGNMSLLDGGISWYSDGGGIQTSPPLWVSEPDGGGIYNTSTGTNSATVDEAGLSLYASDGGQVFSVTGLGQLCLGGLTSGLCASGGAIGIHTGWTFNGAVSVAQGVFSPAEVDTNDLWANDPFTLPFTIHGSGVSDGGALVLDTQSAIPGDGRVLDIRNNGVREIYVLGDGGLCSSAGGCMAIRAKPALPPRGDELWGVTCHNGSATTFGAGGTFTWDGSTPNSEGIISAPSVWDYGCYSGGTASAPDGGSNNVIWIQNSTNAIPSSNTCFTVRAIWRAAPKLVNTNIGLFSLYTAQSGTIQVHANTAAGNLIWTVWNGSTSSDNVIPADASAYNGLSSGANMLTVMYYTSGWTAWLNGERVVRATGLPSPLPTFTIGGTGWRWDFGTGAVLQQMQVWNKCTETTAQEMADWATIQGF